MFNKIKKSNIKRNKLKGKIERDLVENKKMFNFDISIETTIVLIMFGTILILSAYYIKNLLF